MLADAKTMERWTNTTWLAWLLLAASLAAGQNACAKSPATMNHSMENALHTNDSSPELANEDRLYDWLIGSWSARVVDYLDDGSKRESTGEWHFGYILEGRAIQDVWISPPRSKRNADTPRVGNRYGTSIRAFHLQEKRWHVTWINPVSGAFNRLVARRVGNDIVQEERGDDGSIIRWVFTNTEKNSARWYGERSMDGGKAWKLEAEFFLIRER
jgi:hypothetical protein